MTAVQTAADTVDLRALMASVDVVAPAAQLTDITANSVQAGPGALFLACNGFKHHGLEFVDEALAKNVAAVVWEPAEGIAVPEFPAGIVNLRVPELGDKVGGIAHRFFNAPSEALAITAITGTNGKTTTAWLAAQALETLGRVSGYMGTLGFGVGERFQPSALTTPGVISVHRRLREMADMGADTVVMEVSSHGIDQGRIDAVRISVAAFTNLSRDHLDYHGSLEAYAATKARLFLDTDLDTAVINVGDRFGAQLSTRLPASVATITVALHDEMYRSESQPDITAELLAADGDGLHIRLCGSYGEVFMRSRLWGRFNSENLLVAVGVLVAHGYSLEESVAALEGCAAPAGRMQLIRSGEQQPRVVVDFAHTPDALENVLKALRGHCSGQLWCIFGCGGDRDAGKRAEMGAIATELADQVIITDDNPRHEDPREIVRQILAGTGTAEVRVEHDRARAIQDAIKDAAAGDVVLIAGKGSESVQIVGDSAHEFSDAAVATQALGQAT
ncbi:MAG: UDP-N-acetylmuramoyl-L-alanyl-D-glutamate--2,6-diaminopimelate ligase [Gammaproteobacteria bacterium]